MTPAEEAGTASQHLRRRFLMHGRNLDIEVRPDGAQVTLALSGELDVTSASTLRCCLDSIDLGFRRIVLDLTDLTFIDSSGVGLIAQVHREGGPFMRELVLHNPTGHVAEVVALMGLATIMPVTSSDERSPLPRPMSGGRSSRASGRATARA
jgi:anti-anti-sigma factor